MAIDSAAKRRNISALHTAITIVGVTPDPTKALFWRQAAGWGYGGVPTSTAEAEAPTVGFFETWGEQRVPIQRKPHQSMRRTRFGL